MLGAIELMIGGWWDIFTLEIPIDDGITFQIWQFFAFMVLVGFLYKKLFKQEGGASK